ncbi:MAG: hypothetical protein M1827_006649, partial [Pycnora praestabilis]
MQLTKANLAVSIGPTQLSSTAPAFHGSSLAARAGDSITAAEGVGIDAFGLVSKDYTSYEKGSYSF